MAIVASNLYSGRVVTGDSGYPLGKAQDIVNGEKGTGTPLRASWVNDQWGFLQALLDAADITPSGTPDQVGQSDYLDAINKIIREPLTLKIFQSPTNGVLTEIQTRTLNGGEVYEVRKTSNDSLATIYSDTDGANEISQDGTNNVSGSNGVVEFYIEGGDYYVDIGGVKSKFSNVVKASDVKTEGEGDVQDFINETETRLNSNTSSIDNLEIGAGQTDTRLAIDSILSQPSDKILYRYLSGVDNSVYVYIPHSGNWFQKWQITNGNDGFDNNVPTAPNGNMWIVNGVTSVLVGELDSELGKDMILTGDYDVFGNVATLNNGAAESNITGSEFILRFVGRPDGGIADVYIDGVLAQQVDMYNPATGGVSTEVVIATNISETLHTVRVETTGTSNPNSTGVKCRVEQVKGISDINYNDLSMLVEINRPLNDGGNTFKIERAALELAVSNTLGGSTVFSGAYHKYCYPTTIGSDRLYVDGYKIDLNNVVTGDYYVASKLNLTQDLTLTNVDTPIANVSMAHTFSANGLNLKSKLTWTAEVEVNRFYQSMWAVKGESVLFGGQSKKLTATGSGSSTSLGVYNTYNAAVWNSTNEWVSYMTANMPANSQQKTGSYVGMYMWDRTTDSKVYMRGKVGSTVIGESFNTDTSFRIGHVPDTDRVLDYDALN